MFRKFFAAVILAVFILSAQIVAAEDYDWSKAKRIGTKAEFARYIENGRRNGQTTFHIVFTNLHAFGIYTKKDYASYKFFNLAPSISCNAPGTMNEDDGTAQITYTLTEYPGTRVANAYLSRNKEQAWMNLTTEEQQLYNIAVGIVDEANKRSSEVEKVRYIHDAICNRVERYAVLGSASAIDALVYRRTDCEGFADAFYMLGRMCGFNVGRIQGTCQGGGHAWNWITFSDGKTYCIDVNNGFNVKKLDFWTFQAMKPYYSCEWEIIPNLQ